MKKLNREKVNQIEALVLVNNEMSKQWINFIQGNPHKEKSGSKIVEFKLTFYIQKGSVSADVFFDEIAKLKK